MDRSIIFLWLFFFCTPFLFYAQSPLEKGIKKLEAGQFSEAAILFNQYLKEYPDNRTAQICYGRAIGLNGMTNQAMDHFETLWKKSPGDMEIGLNVAESCMWKGDYHKAIATYNLLLNIDSLNNKVYLGYANALFAVKDFKAALNYINTSLKISNQELALISKKYILLNLSETSRNQGNLDQAHQYLDSIFKIFPSEKRGLLAKAELYLIAQEYKMAEDIYGQLITSGTDTIEAGIGLSYVHSLFKQFKHSLYFADMAIEKANEMADSSLIIRSTINKINILGACRKFNDAHILASDLGAQYASSLPTQLAVGRLYLWQEKYRQAMDIYQELENSHPEVYEVWIGNAELMIALNKIIEARICIDKALDLAPHRTDAKSLLQIISGKQQGHLSISSGASFDNQQNTSFYTGLGIQLKSKGLVRPLIQMNYKSSSQKTENPGADRWLFQSGFIWQPGIKLKIRTIGGIAGFQEISNHWKLKLVGALDFQYRFSSIHSGGFNINRKMDDYNVEMINNGLSLTNFSLNYSGNFPIGLGLYAQAGTAVYSDQNIKKHFFLSLFYQIKQAPFIKAGLNYTFINFTKPNQTLYFSPESFQSGEIFAVLDKVASFIQKTSLNAEIALGFQQSKPGIKQLYYRWKAGVKWKLSEKILLEAMVQGSNSAGDTSAGYAYNHLECRMICQLGK